MAYDWTRILSALTEKDAQARLSAAAALELALKEELENGRTEWEPLVATLLPPLIQAVGDPLKGVQVHAANCLQFLTYQSPAVIAALRVALSGDDAWRAWGAAIVAARTGYWYPEVGAALCAAMGATDRDVRWAAAGFCVQLGRNHPEAVAMVKETLSSANPQARKMAAYCLGSMGQYADVETALAACLADPERDVRRAVILAIQKLPRVSPAVREKIASLRHDPDEYVRRTAAAVAAKL